MSTNCLVALKQENGYEAIYVHWDGYTNGVGRTLMENFNTQESASELVALGNCSKVAGTANIEEVVAYNRDRGDPWSDTQSEFFSRLEDFIDFHPYTYIFQDGAWYVSTILNRNLIPVQYALMEYDKLVTIIQSLWDDWNFGEGKQESKDLLDVLCIERDARNIQDDLD
jgi:hypothetical protein